MTDLQNDITGLIVATEGFLFLAWMVHSYFRQVKWEIKRRADDRIERLIASRRR